MSFRLSIFLFTIFMFCHCLALTEENQKAYEYKINKITKCNDWYIIYARHNDSIFKIVSSGTKNNNRDRPYEKIHKSHKYKLNLYPILGGTMLGYEIVTSFKLSRQLDSITVVHTEPEHGINIVYGSYNLDGLYYIPDSLDLQ